VDEVHRVGEDRHLLGDATNGRNQLVVTVEFVPKAFGVEILLREFGERVGVPRRQVDSYAQLLSVVEIDFGPGANRLALPHVGRRLAVQRFEKGLDVLAGAERIRAKIGASAGIVANFETANLNRVLPAGVGVADLVIGKDAVAAKVLDCEMALLGPSPPDVD